MIHVPDPKKPTRLPIPGTRDFEQAIHSAESKFKKLATQQDERIAPELVEERRLADAFLDQNADIIKAIARRTRQC